MDIFFAEGKLQKLCEQQSSAQKKLGEVCARKLRSRLADLRAAESVKDIASGRPHPLKGDRAGEFALNLEGAKRLVFKPASDPIPYREDRSIDWFKISSIYIVFVGDYHD